MRENSRGINEDQAGKSYADRAVEAARERNESERIWCADYCRKYWPGECAHILRIADDAVRGSFLFDLPWDMEQTSEAVTFTGEIDWQYLPQDDPEFIFQFNRHRFWICLGQAYALTKDETYARCFAEQLLSWLKANPLTEQNKHTTWRTIEAGIRGEHWTKAIGYFADSPSLTEPVWAAFEQGLRIHGDYLLHHHSPFSDKSNWGVIENHGLFDIGAWLGEREYMDTALDNLERELAIQIMDDGVHWEQSPLYHNEVLRCILEVLRVGSQQKLTLPPSLAEAARAMCLANLAWIKPDGTQPVNGDSDRTDLRDVLTPAACLLGEPRFKAAGYQRLDFESVWELGPDAAITYEQMETVVPADCFQVLAHSGNWCLRSGWEAEADYLHVVCGSLGGGHGHMDKLHLDLCIGGEDVLIDSGRYTYVDGKLRRYLKSAAAHNVPLIDGAEYTQCTGSWDVTGTAAPIGQHWCRKGQYTFFQGSHLGYLSQGMLVNRRILSIGTRIHVIVDEFYGMGRHVCSQRFHLNPGGKTELTQSGFRFAGHNSETEFIVLSEGCVSGLEMCPVSFHYNKLEQAPCVTVSREGALPLSIITVIAGYDAGASHSVEAAKTAVIAPAASVPAVSVPVADSSSPVEASPSAVLKDDQAEAVVVSDGEHRYLAVFNHRETGADSEYIGADGCFGLGRVMVSDRSTGQLSGQTSVQTCIHSDGSRQMTVMQW